MRASGVFTGTTSSPSRSPRQSLYRYAIRAGRNLPDKEFRYLRTVIVTAAVHRGFRSDLRPLRNCALALTFRHRAGVTPYTSYSTLQRAVFLLNSRRALFTAAPSGYEPYRGTPSPEVTGLMCLVPERAFSRAPVEIILVYLCRFVVRAPSALLRGFSWQREIRDFAAVWPRNPSHR